MAETDLRVSYAQNGEDIVLARGLRADAGFYVDIGAFDPHVDSVTKLFYERGWRGINVDPVPEVIALFERDRPRDRPPVAVPAGGSPQASLPLPSVALHTATQGIHRERPGRRNCLLIVFLSL